MNFFPPQSSGGGGGSTAWADITSKPSTFPPDTHSHIIADVTGLQTALDGKQLALLEGTVSVSVSNGAMEAEQTFAATGMTGSSRVFVSLGTMADSAENAADMLDLLSIGAVPGTDTLTVQMAFASPQAGAIPVNWSVI